jgi:hypothetical protein
MPNGEVWSVNPVYRLGTGGTVPVSDAQLTTIATAINARTVSTGILTMWSTSTSITGVRLEARLITGELQTIVEGSRAVPAVGSGSNTHPFQTAMVTSLRTGTSGPRGRGRLYWPATAFAMSGATLRVNATSLNSFLLGVKTYLSGIETDIEASVGGASLAVWSRTSDSIDNVATIQAGDVLDTQRRRRDALIEAFQTTTYP